MDPGTTTSMRRNHTPPTARTGQHVSAIWIVQCAHRACLSTLARNKKSHRCRASASLMGGVCIQRWFSPPTHQVPKKHQYVMLKPRKTQNNPGRRRKKRGTSSLPLLRTKPKPSMRRAAIRACKYLKAVSPNMAPLSS